MIEAAEIRVNAARKNERNAALDVVKHSVIALRGLVNYGHLPDPNEWCSCALCSTPSPKLSEALTPPRPCTYGPMAECATKTFPVAIFSCLSESVRFSITS
ncbi:MAG: hypothetical protein IPN37_05830 [Betaproteobacteria bacterium]|nr:hypothetical protein [Betaproteobacteria bacterium]